MLLVFFYVDLVLRTIFSYAVALLEAFQKWPVFVSAVVISIPVAIHLTVLAVPATSGDVADEKPLAIPPILSTPVARRRAPPRVCRNTPPPATRMTF